MKKLLNLFEKATLIEADTNLSQDQKNLRLSQLLTAMEREYKIPIFLNDKWVAENPRIYNVYKEISDMRKL